MTDVCTPQAENSAYPTRGVIEAAKVHTAVAKVSIATAEEAIHRAWQMIGVCKAHTADLGLMVARAEEAIRRSRAFLAAQCLREAIEPAVIVQPQPSYEEKLRATPPRH